MGVFLARLQGALDRYDRSHQALVIAAWREDSPFSLPFLRSSIMLIDSLCALQCRSFSASFLESAISSAFPGSCKLGQSSASVSEAQRM
jgi:hypothetical protein